jgi:transposase
VDVLGIDISKGEFHCCLLEGSRQSTKVFPNNPAGYRRTLTWLKNRRCTKLHACMEATGAYWLGLAGALHAGKVDVSVVNPSRIAYFGRSQLRRTKTDRVDAQMIAEYCRTQQPPLWSPPPPEILELRGFLSYREQLVAERTRLKQVAAQVTLAPELRTLHARQLKQVDAGVASVEKLMQALQKRHPQLAAHVDRVESPCGYGFISAVTMVAHLPVDRLRNAKAAAAYVGLSPRDRQSGTSVHGKPRICKTGNAQLRRALYMPALSAMRYNPVLRTFAQRLKDAGKPPKVIIVAVMRKLVTLAFRLLTDPDFQPAAA